jgi:predicted DNA repair protein MutK
MGVSTLKNGFSGGAQFARGAAATASRDLGRSTAAWETSFEADDEADIMQTVQMIGGAVIGIAIITIVVNAVLTTDAVNASTGPFSGVIGSLETTGVSAMTLLVIGLLVAAASQLMSFFRGGF